ELRHDAAGDGLRRLTDLLGHRGDGVALDPVGAATDAVGEGATRGAARFGREQEAHAEAGQEGDAGHEETLENLVLVHRDGASPAVWGSREARLARRFRAARGASIPTLGRGSPPPRVSRCALDVLL